jgi:integrase
MGKKHVPGLQKIGGIWHIDKRVNGSRICESTGTGNLEEAEKYLIRKLEAIRQAVIYGIRPKRIFRDAAIKFVRENQHKRSIRADIWQLRILDAFVGELSLESIHMGALQPFIESRKKENLKMRTVNLGLQLIRHILNLAATEWIDEYGLTWLASAPKIKLLPEHDGRKPYPLDWDEQERLFAELPSHLKEMALFAVNTGCRDQEVCRLKWDWEMDVPGIGSVFIVPGTFVKNTEDRLVVLNRIASEVIERQRGKHSEFVFIYRGKPILRMLNNGWTTAREKVGLDVRVHDLKHTFGRRLRSAGVSFEDRQDLLGHKSSRITTHYSAAELDNLIVAANTVCDAKASLKLTPLRTFNDWGSRKTHEPKVECLENLQLSA